MAHKMSQQICLAVTITKGEFYAYTIKKNQENNVTKHSVNDTGSLTGVWHEKNIGRMITMKQNSNGFNCKKGSHRVLVGCVCLGV